MNPKLRVAMNTMKILLVEDNEQQQIAFKSSVAVFNDSNQLNVEYEIAKDISGALKKIDGSYDGAIIDLRLDNDEEDGNEIVRQLGDSFTRIPIIFVTVFVDEVIDHPSVIKKRHRIGARYESDLALFQEIYNTGLTRIMGGRGIIEESLSKVFLENLLPQIDIWRSYGETDPERTEKALLRYTLNHLFQLLEEDDEKCFPEEVYLYPPMSENFTTGSIVTAENQWFVVLSPACDLVIKKNGEFRTDCVLCVEIENTDDILDKVLTTAGIKRMRDADEKKERTEKLLEKIFKDNYTFYYHWLPETDFFKGGFLNFRKLQTLSEDEFRERFQQPCIQISPFAVKDIVSRFSSYYGEKEQPDLDNEDFIDHYTQQQS